VHDLEVGEARVEGGAGGRVGDRERHVGEPDVGARRGHDRRLPSDDFGGLSP
jgi:hypothetical protein